VSHFLGRGLRFPLRPVVRGDGGARDERRGLAWSQDEAQVAQSIWLILATAPGERLMRPTFGCGIHELVFAPNTAGLRDEVVQRVRTALTRFEPRIDLDQVGVREGEGEGQPNQLLIEIAYRLRANNALYNMVYPFYLQEGAA
jgi:phage baseplate assembly protein W